MYSEYVFFSITYFLQYFAFLIPNLNVLKVVGLTLANQGYMAGVNYYHRNTSTVGYCMSTIIFRVSYHSFNSVIDSIFCRGTILKKQSTRLVFVQQIFVSLR